MAKSNKNSAVDFYFIKETKWPEEIAMLRAILLSCKLEEKLKWGAPCYTSDDHNVVLIHVFKNYCALLFFKGALLKDDHQLLVQQSKNVQSARQIRFTDITEIKNSKSRIKEYVEEAIEVEKSGKKVALKKTEEYKVPGELEHAFKMDAAFKKAFAALTPGRQRGYLLYFSQAKQTQTREARIVKHRKDIFDGKGLND